jgi:uncharacterized protein
LSLKKLISVVLGGAVAVLLCLGLLGAGFCAATLHVPKRTSVAPSNATTVDVLAKDKVRLSGWWLRAPQSNGNCVIVLHGIADSRASSVGFAATFLSEGYSVLVPDSRGHGESGGDYVTYGLLEKFDVVDWTNWMKGQSCRRIYGLGESLGAAILIQAAPVDPNLAAIVAECPYADLKEIGEYRIRQLSRMPSLIATPLAILVVNVGMIYAKLADGLDFRQVSPVKSIGQTSTPILLIHGLDDVRTPPSHSRELAAANPKDPLWLVPNTGHTLASVIAPEEFRRRVLNWFAEH